MKIAENISIYFYYLCLQLFEFKYGLFLNLQFKTPSYARKVKLLLFIFNPF